MAEPENFTAEQAQALLEEVMGKTPDTATTVVVPADTAHAPVPVVPETPIVPVVEEKKEPAATVVPAAVTEVKPAETPAVVPAAPVTTVTTDPYAWVNEIPEALRDKVVKEIQARQQTEHRNRSDSGRIAALQRKLGDVERERTRPPAVKPAPAAQPKPTPEGWTEVVKSDPELAKAVEARVKSEVDTAVDAVKAEIQELRETAVEPLHENERQRYLTQEREALKRVVHNYEEVTGSPVYREWLDNYAAPGVRKLAYDSVDHRDAIFVLQNYAQFMTANGYGEAPKAPVVEKKPDTQAPVVPVVSDTSAADKIEAARAAALKTPSVVPASTPMLSGGGTNGPVRAGDEAERIFLESYNKINKKT